jgi:hypothetical protein
MSDWYEFDNVLRVASLLSEEMFDELFPVKDDFYTYDDFMHAVGKFPAFCNEWWEDEAGLNTADLDETCSRELSTLFAHMAVESGMNDSGYSSVDPFMQGLHFVDD